MAHDPSTRLTLILCIVLNLAFVVVEAIVGFTKNSLGLLSDAGHNLGDVFSLAISLLAVGMAARAANKHFTYGYKKSTILASLANAVILLVAVGAILVECVSKFRHPEAVSGAAVSWTAAAGIVVNGLTTLLLMGKQKGDLNMRGAFVHMMMDTLVSLGVVVSGIVINLHWLGMGRCPGEPRHSCRHHHLDLVPAEGEHQPVTRRCAGNH